VTLH
jgi:hypothetical protein